MLATEYAAYYKIDPQAEGETDLASRERVSGALRDMGHIIEAHEAYQDKRYEESEDVMTGLFGATAQRLHGVNYHSTGSRQVGDDIAVGHMVKNPKPEMSAEMALLAILMSKR